MEYDFEVMMNEAERIKNVNRFSIGKSVMGRDILCLSIGNGKKKLLLAGAYHGLEYLTAAFLIKLVSGLSENTEYMGYNMTELFDKVTLYVVPMVNPDGVDIAVNGLDITNPRHRDLISRVGVHDFTKVWQANANGVDINHNFDAAWQKVHDTPSPSKYGGEFPESECETKAVADFIRKEEFDMMIAFHSQGGEIYYDFGGKEGERSAQIAEKMARASGYKMAKPEGTASYGGCKDWFIEEFGREGFTVEMGYGKNPLPLSMLEKVYSENARLVLCVMNEM